MGDGGYQFLDLAAVPNVCTFIFQNVLLMVPMMFFYCVSQVVFK